MEIEEIQPTKETKPYQQQHETSMKMINEKGFYYGQHNNNDNDEITEKSPNKYKIDYDTGEILENEETPENADKVDNLEELTKTFDRNIVIFLYNLLDGKVNLG